MQLNVVYCTDNEEEKFRVHADNWGVDFIFNYELEELNVVTRYESYLQAKKLMMCKKNICVMFSKDITQ